MRIETLIISLFLFAFGTVGCSQPEPVKAEYEAADCNCAEKAASADKSAADHTSTDHAATKQAPPAKSEGLADNAVASDEAAQPGDEPNEHAEGSDEEPMNPKDETVARNDGANGKGDPNGVVNLNTASVDQLMALPGVGPALAARIVEFRQKRRFEETKHLLRVKGIGQATFSKLRPMLAVSGETTLAK